ncbi:MAG TPA: 1,4-dihydroxy-2-naphthoate octaprenyltransferase [Desulfobacteraceae bacterium]|nr:1,4-dihydroxy-2-naphthoate octaprenyltransferase [Desulfobacteraceae bacterium]
MNKLKYWFLAARPWSFAMSAISVTVGAVLASFIGHLSVFLYLLTVAGIVFIHAGGNLLNDYFDVTGGIDTLQAGTARYRPHPLLEGKLTPAAVRNAACAFLAAGCIFGIALTVICGWPVFVIGVLGAFGAVAYTAPQVGYKYIAFGELGVFLIWGPLMVGGAYFVQTGRLEMKPVLVSLPLGILVAQTLLANNMRDIEHDTGRGVKTLAALLGETASLKLYLLLMVFAYAAVVIMVFPGPLNKWSLLVFLSVPLASRLLREMRRGVPEDADARTANLNIVFGLLLVISLILETAL